MSLFFIKLMVIFLRLNLFERLILKEVRENIEELFFLFLALLFIIGNRVINKIEDGLD